MLHLLCQRQGILIMVRAKAKREEVELLQLGEETRLQLGCLAEAGLSVEQR